MADVRTEVASYLNTVLPGQIGPGRRWDDGFVTMLIDMVDREIREYCELSWDEQEIALVSGHTEYGLDPDFISVYQVEYAEDGSTYDHTLYPTTMSDLDNVSRLWRDDSSGRPSRYDIYSTPGIPQDATSTKDTQILIYPKPASTGSATIKVTGIICQDGATAPGAAQFAIDSVYIPYVRCLLVSGDNEAEGAGYYRDYLDGRERLRAAIDEQYVETLPRQGSLNVTGEMWRLR